MPRTPSKLSSSPDAPRSIPGGLRAQLLVGMTLLFMVVLALISIAVLHITRQQIDQMTEERVAILARLLAQEMSDEEEPRLEKMLSFQRDGQLQFVSWRRGELFMLRSDVVGLDTHVPELEERLQESTDARLLVEHEGVPYRFAAVRLSHLRQQPTAIVGVSLEVSQSRFASTRRFLSVYTLVNAVLFLILGYAFLTFWVVRPIRALGVATERAAQGNLASPISVLPHNELGQVGASFNIMLERLEEGRERLETKVLELEDANEQLQRTRDSLLRSEKLASVGQLAAGVAHEVGNPLAAIFGYVDLAGDQDLEPEERAEILQRVRKQLDRIRTIIRELLDFSRDDSGQSLAATSLASCVQEACDLACATPRAKKMALRQELPDDLPPVQAIASQVTQVLINLVINAADAMSKQAGGGTLTISASSDEHHVRLRVQDDGPGMDDATQARIFDPFFTTKEPGEGTGLGLAVCLRIMQRFGGDILVESTPGQGTCFVLTFERHESEGSVS